VTNRLNHQNGKAGIVAKPSEISLWIDENGKKLFN
jgi:hypothetical protein